MLLLDCSEDIAGNDYQNACTFQDKMVLNISLSHVILYM
jgi:hypothetical protein